MSKEKIIRDGDVHLVDVPDGLKIVKLKVKKSIIQELQNIAIPQNVMLKANNIFISQNLSLRKGQKLPHLLFYCVYNAYRQLGEPKVPKKIATLVGLSPNEISRALSMFNKINTGEQDLGESNFSSFVNFIPCYCEDLGINMETVLEIQKFGRELLEICPDLDEKFPQNISAAVILYWMTIHGVNINRKDFQAKVDLSDVTISNAFKLIKSVHNSY